MKAGNFFLKVKNFVLKAGDFFQKVKDFIRSFFQDRRCRSIFLLACAAFIAAVAIAAHASGKASRKADAPENLSAVSSSSGTASHFIGNTDRVKGYTASGERIEETESVSAFLSSSSDDTISGFDPDDWRLVLVNKTHYLPENWTVQTVNLDDGIYINECFNGVIQEVDRRIYGDLTAMLHDCLDDGYQPVVCSGYRSHDKQIGLYDDKVARVEASENLPEDQAKEEAATVVAIPGTSEHELGLALDIYCRDNLELDESQENEPTQQWLMANCWKYGFILRYPKDKTAITGITYEPWHYRYVGKDAAAVMQKRGLCLEEFLEKLKS